MAAAQVLPLPNSLNDSLRADRQAMIDSVLGTMGAEGEPPSAEAQTIMQSFVAGDITLDEMSEAIILHATRMVHEANSRRLSV